MDAHFFRRLANELANALNGARIERFYAPVPNVTTIVLHTSGPKQHLLLRAGRRFPLLFLTPDRPENPDTPSAHAMWLRKFASGRRMGQGVVDWISRSMAFPLSGTPMRWLMLSLRDGVTVIDTLPIEFGTVPQWPDHADFSGILRGSDVWEAYPHYTPLLRETLAQLAADDPMDARALLVDLEYGPGDCSSDVYLYSKKGVAEFASVWPLMPAQYKGYEESIAGTAMEASLQVGRPALFGKLTRQTQSAEAVPLNAALKRYRKTLVKLDAEEKRLQAMLDGQSDALALQAELWRLGTDQKVDSVNVLQADGVSRSIRLDPLLTVRENMERMFKQAGRGKRGIGMLNARRVFIREQIEKLERGDTDAIPEKQASTSGGGKTKEAAGGLRKSGKKPAGKGAAPVANKLYQRFRSSDGLMMIRGRNAKGNHEILNKAMPHDLWFHAEDGPSAHLILRLEFPGQEVPDRTVLEAAELVGVKSWQRDAGQARIMCAFARNVRKVKGAAVGAVHVSRMERSVLVDLTSEIERLLAIDGDQAEENR